MRKFLGVLMAVTMVMSLMAINVSAAGELSQADLEALPKPGDDVNLISFIDLEEHNGVYSYPSSSTGEVRLSNMLDEAKVVVYNVASGTFLYMGNIGSVEYPCIVSQSTNSLQAALAGSETLIKTDRFDSYVSGAYVLFFDASATSLSDVKYCVSSEELLNHYEPDKISYVDSGENKFVVTVVEKRPSVENPTSATFRLDYELNKGDEFYGKYREEKLSKIFVDTLNCIYVEPAERKVQGSIEFTFDTLVNGEYNIDIYTDMGNTYKTSFVIDFGTGVSNMFDKYTGSYDAPVVSFEGLPASGTTGLLEPMTIKVLTDIPAQLTFDGDLHDKYTTSTEVVLSGNGEYRYIAVSEVGQVTEGVLTVDFFDPNMSIAIPGYGLDMDRLSLVQTGDDGTSLYSVIGIVGLVGICVVLGGAVLVKRRNRA